MKKPVFSLDALVRISINIKESDDPKLIIRLGHFLEEKGITRAASGGSNDPYFYVRYFSMENAKKIEKWLLEQKVKKVNNVYYDN